MVCFRIPKFQIGRAGLLIESTRLGSGYGLAWFLLRACLVCVTCLGLVPIAASAALLLLSPATCIHSLFRGLFLT